MLIIINARKIGFEHCICIPIHSYHIYTLCTHTYMLLYSEVDIVCCKSCIFNSEKYILHGAVPFIKHRLSINDLFSVCHIMGREIEPVNRHIL